VTAAIPTAAAGARISVVVLTYNRVASVLETVRRLRALPEQPPVIVADNGSTDATVALIDLLHPDVRVVQCARNLGAAGRNRAVQCVDTDYIAFCDDDTWWEPGSLAHAVRLLDAAPSVAVLNARVIVGEMGGTDPACEEMRGSPLNAPGLPGPALIGFMAGACVFRTSVFRKTGGYDPRLFIGGEEECTALDVLAAGHAIVYCDALAVVHQPSSIRDSALRRRLLARNAAWTAWLRLPAMEAIGRTWHALICFRREHTLWRDGWAMLGGLGWILRERRRLPQHVLAMRSEVRRSERTARNMRNAEPPQQPNHPQTAEE